MSAWIAANFWSRILPGGVVAAWILAEWLRLRKIRAIGDPAVMGIPTRWVPRIAALLMLATAVGLAGAAIPRSVMQEVESAVPTAGIRLLLDAGSLDSAGNLLWDSLEHAIRDIFELTAGEPAGVFAPGRPAEVLIPPTVDVSGVRMLAGRLRFELQTNTGAGVVETVADMVGDKSQAVSARQIVILSSRSEEEIQRLAAGMPAGGSGVLFVALSGSGSAASYGRRTAAGAWEWNSQPGMLRDWIRLADSNQDGRSAFSDVQWLALAALLLLWGEHVVSLAARSSVRSGRLAPDRVRLLLVWILLWVFAPNAGAQGVAAEPDLTVVSGIAPDLAIVTEFSLREAYVGQQFCVIYRLRAQRPPAAVDVDPQQYPGFWTEMVPLSRESASEARPVKGRAAVDYLLRQVVAFPIREGMLQMPPLSVKIKRSVKLPAQRDDWDVAGASEPIPIRAVLPPAGLSAGRGLPLVGSFSASMRRAETIPSALVLEIEGTANLALFQPLDWLTAPPGVRYSARLDAADTISRTLETGGKRQLSVLHRQRWWIQVSSDTRNVEAGSLSVPVFDPQTSEWQEVRVAGVTVSDPEPLITVSREPALRSPSGEERNASGPILFKVTVAAALAGILVGAFLLLRRRKREEGIEEMDSAAMEKLMRTSPRAFLDSAHRLLERHAVKIGRRRDLGSGDAELDRIWTTIQHYRFGSEILPEESRTKILESIRQICRADGPEKEG